MFNLGTMYRHGKHVTQDILEAIRLYQLAAEADLEDAFFALCELYTTGEGPVRPNFERAVEAAKLSADRGHFRGIVQFAGLLENGVGVQRDHERAEALLAKAHSKQYAVNQNNYAFDLELGNGCRPQPEEAVKYYRIAAENGNAGAMQNLGFCYTNGSGVPQGRG
jgi:TPR repeat protein